MSYKLATLVLAMSFFSCKKSSVSLTPLASLNVTNAVVGGAAIKLGSNATSLSNNAYTVFGLVAGSGNVYLWPTGDSTHPYYNRALATNNGDVYSLFLAGTTTQIDTVLIKETIPYRADSTGGIRFINLSPNSTPLNITLSTTPTVNEVAGLAYKQYTAFKTYPTLYNTTYTFQVRDATTPSPATPLATFALTTTTVPRFANITVVIKGLVGGSPVINTLRVNNDR